MNVVKALAAFVLGILFGGTSALVFVSVKQMRPIHWILWASMTVAFAAMVFVLVE